LYPCDDDGEDGEQKHEAKDGDKASEKDTRVPVIGELEIMIARPESRGKGLAQEALRAFIWYISTSLPAILQEYTQQDKDKAVCLRYLRVKIDKENKRSLALFEKLGFEHSSGPNYFGEMELRARVPDAGGEGNATMAVSLEKLSYGSL
jgi:GNAT superfamily N-acetyltransferase